MKNEEIARENINRAAGRIRGLLMSSGPAPEFDELVAVLREETGIPADEGQVIVRRLLEKTIAEIDRIEGAYRS